MSTQVLIVFHKGIVGTACFYLFIYISTVFIVNYQMNS